MIPILGKISGHPDNTSGLVMSLIDSSFINLAGPPSLESCTRDIYPAERRFSLASVLHIALNIAAAVEHLHAQGVMHGDLYAHNILLNERSSQSGDCLLGDFGGASFVPRNYVCWATGLQRLEVRAFACLLEELLDRCDASLESQDVVKALRDLQNSCTQPAVNHRPLFGEIRSALALLVNANTD